MELEDFIKENKNCCKQKIIRLSESENPIRALHLKKGKGLRKKALLTSYIHGNEPETLQANLTTLENVLQHNLLDSWEIMSIPVANPYGKQLRTRYNLIGIDLNRDFIAKKAKETKTIIKIYEKFKPEIVLDYHSNLSNNFSCIMVPESIDMSLCQDIIFSYQEIREQTNLPTFWSIMDINKDIMACFHTKGMYILRPSRGLFVEYASQKSRIAAAIEDYGTELSIEFSTELLKRY